MHGRGMGPPGLWWYFTLGQAKKIIPSGELEAPGDAFVRPAQCCGEGSRQANYNERRKLSRFCCRVDESRLNLSITPFASDPS